VLPPLAADHPTTTTTRVDVADMYMSTYNASAAALAV